MSQGWNRASVPLDPLAVWGTSQPATGAFTVLIAGVDRSEWIGEDGLNFRTQFNQRASLSATLQDRNLGYIPLVGMPIIVLYGPVRLFGGYLTQVKITRHATRPSVDYMQYELEATDNNLIGDRRLVYYAGLTGTVSFGPDYAGNIVKAMVSNSLTGEGVTVDGVADGPYIPAPITFFYENFSAAMNKICQLAGAQEETPYRWRIDEYKDLQFGPFDTAAAPFDIDESGPVENGTPNWLELEVSHDLKNYRNVDFERTESSLTGTDTETFIGDGVTRDFFIGFVDGALNPVRWMTSIPEVTLDDLPLTVATFGIDGLGNGFDCSYDQNGIGIHFLEAADPTQPAPGVGAVLRVTYTYVVGNVVTQVDSAEILARQAIEGGSGRWEKIGEQRNVSDGNTLLGIAQGNIEFYGLVPNYVQYRTIKQGLMVGQMQTFTLARHGFAGTLLIESIDTRYKTQAPYVFEHTVKASDIGPMAAPEFVLEKLAEVARIGIPRVSEVRSDIVGQGGGGGTPTTGFVGRQSNGAAGNWMGTTASPGSPAFLDGNPGPFTFACWVRNDNLAQVSKVVFQISDLSGTYQFAIRYWTGGQYSLYVTNYTGANPNTGSDITPPDTDWHHLCYRKAAAGSSSWDKFLDGSKTVMNGAIDFALSNNMQKAFMLADRQDQFPGVSNFVGAIAEGAIWRLALTDAQIMQLAAQQHAIDVEPNSLVGYWPIDGTSDPEPDLGIYGYPIFPHGTLPPAT